MKFDEIIAKSSGKTLYRLGDSCYKVFDESYSKAGILNEALNTARVEDTGLHIPKIREVTNVDGKWAIVMDYVKGQTMTDRFREQPDQMDTLMEQFVDIQLDVLSHKCPLLSRLKDKMHGKISASSFPATIRYDLHTTLESMPKHLKLCHGDFNPSNIIFGEDGNVYIIDWAHATQGNASADAARTYLLFCLNEREDVAKKYLKLFCEKSDTAIQYVQKWMPIVAASQSVKGNDKERAFLERWVNVVDYV